MKRFAILGLLIAGLTVTSGCFLTKIVTVPMRLVASVVSIVPVVGNKAHDAVDESAELVDELPF